MNQALRDQQLAAGATVASVNGVEVVSSFGNEAIARQAAQTGVALCDRSHWGRIKLSGEERLRFLHNQSTNDFNSRQPGQGCDTVFVTPTARTLDLVTAYILEDAVLLLTHPSCRQSLLAWMDRFIFPFDKVSLNDITDDTATFSLIGPKSHPMIESLGAAAIAQESPGTHQVVAIDGIEVRVAVGSGLALPGYTLIFPADAAATIWQRLTNDGAVPLGEQDWDYLRIQQGRPVPGQELTEDYNPLEAGLWQTISFSKGCYIGQETIARLDTYNGVKQQLWGVKLSAIAPPGTVATVGDDKVGKLTSSIETDSGAFGLAYIRTKAGGESLTVNFGDVEGVIVDVPFLTHHRVDEAASDA